MKLLGVKEMDDHETTCDTNKRDADTDIFSRDPQKEGRLFCKEMCCLLY
jgi:hypothetical protein